MSGGSMMPTEADDLLAHVRESIKQASTDSSKTQTPHFVTAPGESSSATGESERLRQAYAAVDAYALALQSLPPSPGTIRGHLGLSLVKIVNRLSWWSVSASARFADAVRQFARLQMEREEQQAQLLTRLEKRVHSLETALSRHAQPQQRQWIEAEAVARVVRQTGIDASTLPSVILACPAGSETLTVQPDASAGTIVCPNSEDLAVRDVAPLLDSAWRVLRPHGLLFLANAHSTNADELLGHAMQRRGFQEVRLVSDVWIGTRP